MAACQDTQPYPSTRTQYKAGKSVASSIFIKRQIIHSMCTVQCDRRVEAQLLQCEYSVSASWRGVAFLAAAVIMACNYYSCSLKLLHTCAIAHAQCGMHTENVAQHVNHTYCAQNLIRTNSYLTVTALRARINRRIGSEQCFIGIISPRSALGI